MFTNNIAQRILFAPPLQGADTLLILSGYATPNMSSWLIKSLQEQNMNPVNISLLIGMVPYDLRNSMARRTQMLWIAFHVVMFAKTLPSMQICTFG